MKKKVLAAFLCAAMTATMFAGCGGGDDKKDDSANNAAGNEAGSEVAGGANEEENQTGDLSDANVAVFYYTYADPYITSVRTALDAKLDGLGVKYQNYESSQAVVDKASNAGIPVIFFNRSVEDDKSEGTVLGSYDKCAFVGTDAPEAGHMQGQMIGEYLVENYDKVDLNKDGKIQYAMMMGELGNAEAIARTQFGVEDANKVLTEAGKEELEYFDAGNASKYQVDQTGGWSAQAATDYMTTNLAQYNEGNNNMIELVICNNDSMAEGVVSALSDKGYNTGDDKFIPVFGVDATDSAKQLIADGKMVGTIKQDAEGMADCIAFLTENCASGKEIMDGTDSYNISEAVSNKIFIPYATYTGEE